jgi:hypothetical protein
MQIFVCPERLGDKEETDKMGFALLVGLQY